MRFLIIALTLLFGVSLAGAQQQQQQKAPAAPKAPATTAQQKAPPAPPAPAKSLYDRLGGEKGVAAVVDDTLKFVLADKRINKFFAKADAAKLGKLVKEQICQATGGPCKYSGRDMKTAHAGAGIEDKHFNAFVENLNRALNKNKVKAKEKKELVALLAPMKKDIVEPPKPKATPATAPKSPATTPQAPKKS